MSGYTVSVLEGMAQDLASAGAGEYRGPDGVFGDNEDVRAIVFAVMPPAPSEAIVLTAYDDQPGQVAVNEVFVQVRSRVGSNPFDGSDLTDLIRDTFHRRTGVVYGTARFNLILQESFAYLGPDANGRLEYTQNFKLTGNRYSSTNP